MVQGIPTRAQLVDRWEAVRRAACQLSTIPQGQGGPLSIAVATLASALKVCMQSCMCLWYLSLGMQYYL